MLFRSFTCSVAVGRKDCAEEGPFIVAVTTVSTVQDLVICILPAFLIRNLQMPKRQKLAVCGIFALGLVTSICGIMRLYYAVYLYYCKYHYYRYEIIQLIIIQLRTMRHGTRTMAGFGPYSKPT